MATPRRPDIRPGVTGSQAGPKMLSRDAPSRVDPKRGKTKAGYSRAMKRPKK